MPSFLFLPLPIFLPLFFGHFTSTPWPPQPSSSSLRVTVFFCFVFSLRGGVAWVAESDGGTSPSPPPMFLLYSISSCKATARLLYLFCVTASPPTHFLHHPWGTARTPAGLYGVKPRTLTCFCVFKNRRGGNKLCLYVNCHL